MIIAREEGLHVRRLIGAVHHFNNVGSLIKTLVARAEPWMAHELAVLHGYEIAHVSGVIGLH